MEKGSNFRDNEDRRRIREKKVEGDFIFLIKNVKETKEIEEESFVIKATACCWFKL